ncbi:MAG: hypothetical protein IJ044_00375, partial [Oscillospiraceae bacterium]|nr:hypothetical protein [Oscillospiraceae bacterium]
MRKRRKTAKAALLCLFCALLMAALPVTALAETETYEPIQEVSVKIEGMDFISTALGNYITITIKGTKEDSVVVPGKSTIIVTNKTEKTGNISFS